MSYAPSFPPPHGRPAYPAPNGPPDRPSPVGAPTMAAPDPAAYGAVSSVLAEPTQPTIPLHKLAPEAALRPLEMVIVRRLEGFLHGDPFGLLPGPGSETNE